MPSTCRQGDSLSTGHDCVGTTTLSIPSQSSVYANDILVARVGDPTVSHPIGAPVCPNHVASVNVGSGSVFVENSAVTRIGDSADAGAMTTGSSDVFSG